MNSTEYDFKEHLHRYGVWTAARAQRAFATTDIINQAINEIKLKDSAFNLPDDYTIEEFDSWHLEICDHLQKVLQKFKDEGKLKVKLKQGEKIAFGRAAKIVNVYLKTTLVIPNCKGNTSLVCNIHPPIDAILLRGLISKEIIDKEKFSSVNWTLMEQEIYSSIIIELRKKFTELWKAEVYWKPEKKVSKKEVVN